MDNLLSLCLEAHNPERNHRRRYEVRLSRDLFGRWMVTIGYGRSGRGGQQRTYSDDDPDKVRAVISGGLARRRSAPRRLGCEYRVRELSAGPGIELGFWFPSCWTPSACPQEPAQNAVAHVPASDAPVPPGVAPAARSRRPS